MSNLEKGAIIFVPCVKWLKQGVAKAHPDEVKLSEEELAQLLAEERAKKGNSLIEEEDESDDSDNDGETTNDPRRNGSGEVKMEEDLSDTESLSKYELDKYDDDDDDNPISGLAGLTLYPSNKHDPNVTIKDSEDEDSEEEDEEIKPNDNLLVVGKVHGDQAVLQIYVYNDNGETFYVHHEILMPDIPLCVEWLNYDPASPTDGNLCAVGGMSPVIQILDLDLMNSLEPAYILGEPIAPKNPISVHLKTKNKLKKKAKNHQGHTDAVLDLAWNTNFTHVLASGSVDETVLLWDLENGKVHTKLTAFTEKVQTLKWHPFEGQTILTGCCDKTARRWHLQKLFDVLGYLQPFSSYKFAKVFDCRSDNSFKAWEFSGEIERVIWDHYNPYCFLASTNKGQVSYVDCRNEKPIWELGAHNEECTGLSFSSQCPGMLITASNEGSLKAWDLADSAKPSCVWEMDLKIGSVQCLDVCPDLPFTIAAGGDKKSRHLIVQDLSAYVPISRTFSSRDLVVPVKVEQTENAATDSGSTSAEVGTLPQDQDEEESSSEEEEQEEPQPGPSNGHHTDSVNAAMTKLKVSQMRKPKLPPRAKIIQKRKKKGSKRADIFSKPT